VRLNLLLDHQVVVRNPDVLLREDFPDAPMLYDPATDEAFALNATGLLIWTHLDEVADVPAMLELLGTRLAAVTAGAAGEIAAFVQQLLARGLAARG
jgi:hypothetical protein